MNLTKLFAILLLVLALALGVGAWMLGRQPARPVAQPAPTAQQPVAQHPVVVAARPIAAGQRLVAEDLKVTAMPATIAGSFERPEALLDRTTVVALAADAPVFEQHLIHGLALQIDAGQRAVSIAVKEPMAAGHHVRPGDFVDVFFTLDNQNEHTQVDTQTRLLLARSRVLAYGQASVENPPPTAEQQRKAQQEAEAGKGGVATARKSGGSGQGNAVANTAVLAVPLEDVERLTLAEKYGQLTLALRHPDDTAVPDPSLFAALPTALQPVSGKLGKGEQLQGADRAYAGLRFKDLATGADARNARRPPAVAPMPLPAAPQAPRLRSVEVHQGATVQTVSY
ncbi:Flp pilus assembly protein CpaB [Comamonas serinivorans]|uniref:Flp pilus assembly protein CpaB n=1 Tax=Comamonas serinivorans TaxID=1082851 RepID=A0A1Y0ELS0_9BURK|nr:Flp pilus assembly protein CpaB [Comamonas serinivorans]ARU04358.1 Flp pilus assembly protein CpaB [Comamonas serinivorans]